MKQLFYCRGGFDLFRHRGYITPRLVVPHSVAHREAEPRQIRQTLTKLNISKPPGKPAQCPGDISGDLGDTGFEVHPPLEMSITSCFHFANESRTIKTTAALVATDKDGSPWNIDAPRHTVHIALTPSAAASILRLLQRHPGELCGDLRQLHDGMMSAATSALQHS